MYTVEYTKDARYFLERQDAKTKRRIMDKIDRLALDPFAVNNNVAKLVERPGYRLRVGDIRVLYDVFNNVLVINVFEIDYRNSVYKRRFS